MPPILWILLTLIDQHHAECNANGRTFEDGEYWIHQHYFNVTCQNNKVKVINCLTDLGTMIPLGTLSFEEHGFNYTCKNRSANGHAPNLFSPLEHIREAEECDQGQNNYVREGFVISCQNNQILGCSDAFGDLVKEGFFVGHRMSLWYCYIYKNRRRAKVERRGCFNGTEIEDPADEQFHMKKGQLWKQTTTTLRCEDNGLQVYKCHPSPNESPHVGTAWFDKENVLNFCQFN